MKRKIVQHGSSSLTITLPVKWTEKFHLKKGDELNVEESGSKLIVTTQSESAGGKIIITEKQGKFTKNNLSHLYQLGYDEIEIELTDKETIKEINERLPNCIGFEIIDQKDNKIYIKSIMTTLESEFDNMLRKCFLITEEMGKDIVEILEKKEFDKLTEARNLESLNNKFTDICIRILNKKGYKIPERTIQMYEIIKNLERTADEFKYICDELKTNKKIEKEFLICLKEAIEYFHLFTVLFYKHDNELKQKIYSERKKLIEKFSRELKNSKNPILFHHLINIIQKIYEGYGGYCALVL
jgi:phosphate uptake regulator